MNVFTYTRTRGSVLREELTGEGWVVYYDDRPLTAYAPADLFTTEARNPWGGMDADTVLDSGRDLLTEQLLSEGEPDFDRVRRLLPPVEKDAYVFLSGAASWSGVDVHLDTGALYPQAIGGNRKPAPLFTPVSVDGKLGLIRPRFFLLGGRLPVLFAVHTDGTDVLEFLYFAEPGDPDRDPVIRIRTKRYPVQAPEQFTVHYSIAALSREVTSRQMPPEDFYCALGDTVAYWLRFEASAAQIRLPEKRLERIIAGTQMSCAVTFAGDHAHYGHRVYGEEVHDNFPPNYLWSLEACCLLGRISWARGIFRHLFTYILTDEGRFSYRQGPQEVFGASAEEYGYLLFLIDRYHRQLGSDGWDEDIWDRLTGMGELLLAACRPCEEADGRILVLMCAEADTNTRIHAYLNNNLWAIRGLNALAALLIRFGREPEAKSYAAMAAQLTENVNALLEKYSVYDPRFGKLPPFRFGYTATPATLSTCKDTFAPMTEAEYREYLVPSLSREASKLQDLTENTYANYRYYPECLSSMLLPEEQAEAVHKLRAALGGEILCMTRFMRELDDWPVLHYARYLLEAGHTDKYLTLLFAHANHHGLPELMCYYEQVTVTGGMRAHDCVPSLLTVPIMSAWMLVYERMNGNELLLGAGVPKAWFLGGVSAAGLNWSGGSADLHMDASSADIRFSSPVSIPVTLVWRAKEQLCLEDIAEGAEAVAAIDGNRIHFKENLTEIHLRFQ